MENIEENLKAIFKEAQTRIPTLHRITFEIDSYEHKRGIFLQGYVHAGRDKTCRNYEGFEGLRSLLEEEANKIEKEVRENEPNKAA